MSDESKTWEERVIALEARVSDLTADRDAAAAALAERESEIDALRATVAAQREAEEARRRAANEQAVSDLRDACCQAQSPLSDDDLSKVRAAYERGDEETAETLADAFLTRAKALGSGSVRGDSPTVTKLGASTGDDEFEKSMEAARRRLNRRKGA